MDATPERLPVRERDGQAASQHVPVNRAAYHPKSYPMLAIPRLVEQQPGGPVVVGYQKVDVAIVVHVAKRNTPAHLRKLKSRASSGTDLFVASVSQVAKQLLALVERIGILSTGQPLYGSDLAVCRYNVQPAVVVKVKKTCAKTGERFAGNRQVRLERAIFEPSLHHSCRG